MKKVFLCICVAAIVALATVNLSLAFKNEAKVANLTLLGTESLAQGEGGDGEGCYTSRMLEFSGGCLYVFEYICDLGGSEEICYKGHSIWDSCTMENVFRDTSILYCKKPIS